MAYYWVSLEVSVGSDVIIKADSEDEVRRILLEKQDDEFDWYYDLTELDISQIDDARGASLIDKSGGRGTLLPRGVIKLDRDHLVSPTLLGGRTNDQVRC